MRKLLFGIFLCLAVGALAVPAAFATSPHFVSATGSVDNNGSLTVSWKEAGLGDNQLIQYTLTASATATYACINGGGNHPKAANKETVSGPVSASGTFSSGKNGNVTASLTAGPPGPGSFACPNGQKLVLASVSYTGITLTDTTNGVSTGVPNISRVFFNV